MTAITPRIFFFFFLNDPAPPESSPLPLHAALPISSDRPSLLSRRPRHQNRLRLCHPQSPRGPKTSVLLVAVTASDESRRPSWSAAKIEADALVRSEEHTSELQSPCNLVCRLLLEKK